MKKNKITVQCYQLHDKFSIKNLPECAKYSKKVAKMAKQHKKCQILSKMVKVTLMF